MTEPRLKDHGPCVMIPYHRIFSTMGCAKRWPDCMGWILLLFSCQVGLYHTLRTRSEMFLEKGDEHSLVMFIRFWAADTVSFIWINLCTNKWEIINTKNYTYAGFSSLEKRHFGKTSNIQLHTKEDVNTMMIEGSVIVHYKLYYKCLHNYYLLINYTNFYEKNVDKII